MNYKIKVSVLTMTYDPNNGIAFADGTLKRELLNLFMDGKDFSFSTDNVISSVRCLVKEGMVNNYKICFKFEDKLIYINCDNEKSLTSWPVVGFGDLLEHQLFYLHH